MPGRHRRARQRVLARRERAIYPASSLLSFFAPGTMLSGDIALLPASAGKLLNLGGAPSWPFGRWRLDRSVGFHPRQNLVFPPTQTSATRELERGRDQMLILLVCRASPDCGFGLADQCGGLFDMDASGDAAALNGCLLGHLLHHRESVGRRSRLCST